MNKLQYLLTKFAEEASEVAQIALKTQQFGPYEIVPGGDKTNIERVNFELNDLLAVAQMINEELGSLELFDSDKFMAAKKAKVQKFLQYSVECGQVDLSKEKGWKV
jgi:NTP pyrophosphatase (non-canonical NTP hydrolase)